MDEQPPLIPPAASQDEEWQRARYHVLTSAWTMTKTELAEAFADLASHPGCPSVSARMHWRRAATEARKRAEAGDAPRQNRAIRPEKRQPRKQEPEPDWIRNPDPDEEKELMEQEEDDLPF